MRRPLAVALAILALHMAPLDAGAAEAKEERVQEVPHYESPILSLLLLPVNLLIRMTSMVSPDADKPAKETSRGE